MIEKLLALLTFKNSIMFGNWNVDPLDIMCTFKKLERRKTGHHFQIGRQKKAGMKYRQKQESL